MGKYNIKLDWDRGPEDQPGETRGNPPESFNGRVVTYCQDGMYFDNDGNLIEEKLTPEQREKLDAAERERIALAEVKEKARQILIDANLDPDSVDLQAVKRKDDGVQHDEEFDFVGWANGTVKLPWTKAREAFKKKYSYSAPNKDAAIEFLQGKIPGIKPPADDDK